MSLRLPFLLLAFAVFCSAGRAATFTYAVPPPAIKDTYRKIPFKFGYLTVLENRADPSSRTIQLAVVILKAKSAAGGKPVFFLTGGPGGSSTEDFVYFEIFSALQKKHDVVLIDQRGTGYSKPFIDVSGSYEAARQKYTNQGFDLSAYNTTQDAADIADLRVALGYDQVILFGNSYGTFLAQEVMRSFPEGIAAVALCGILPATDTFIPNFNRNTLHGLNALFKDVRQNGPARRAFPDFSRTYYDLLTRLNRGPISFGPSFRITIDDFQGTIQALLQSSERIKLIPLLVAEITARHDTPWLRRYFSFSSGPRDFAYGMYLSVLGSDWNQPDWLQLTKKSDATLTPAIFRRANAPASVSVVAGVRAWKVPYNPLSTRDPLVSDIPTLLLRGQMEAQTPYDGGVVVGKGLSTKYEFLFPRSGHITGFTPGPSLSALVQFADDPTRRPSVSLASLKVNNFYLTQIPPSERDRGPERPLKFQP